MAERIYQFVCPKCHGHNVSVSTTTVMRLHQWGDGEFETEIEGDTEWGPESTMWCNNCNFSADSVKFDTYLKDDE